MWKGLPPRRLRIAVYALASTTILYGLLSVGAQRPPKRVDIIGQCDAVLLPAPVVWPVPSAESLHVRGFTFELTNLAISVVTGPLPRRRSVLKSSQVAFDVNEPRAEEPPSLVLKGARFGADSQLELPAGTTIQGEPEDAAFGPIVRAVLPPRSPGKIEVKADTLQFSEVNRLILRGAIPDWMKAAETVSVEARGNGHRLVNAAFTPIERYESPPEITLRFAETASALLDVSGRWAATEGLNLNMSFTGCFDPIVKIDQQDSPRRPTGITYPLKFSGSELQLDSVRVMKGERTGLSRSILEVHVSGTANSLVVGQAELIPTRWGEFQSGTWQEQGAAGIGLFLAACGMVIVLKRCVEKLADTAIASAAGTLATSGAVPSKGPPHARASIHTNGTLVSLLEATRLVEDDSVPIGVKPLLRALIRELARIREHSSSTDARMSNSLITLVNELSLPDSRRHWCLALIADLIELGKRSGKDAQHIVELAESLQSQLLKQARTSSDPDGQPSKSEH